MPAAFRDFEILTAPTLANRLVAQLLFKPDDKGIQPALGPSACGFDLSEATEPEGHEA